MKKKKVICLIIVLLIIVIGIIFGTSRYIIYKTENNEAKDKIILVANEFYEETYFETMNKELLKDFTKKGINVSLEELFDYESIDITTYKNYDLSKSKVIIYPKEPYNKKDYKVEIKLYRN